MLSFFRINDPYRLVFVFALLLVFRLPFMIGGLPLTIPELNWMIVGETLNQGKMLYRDLWENIGPFSAYAYQVMDMLFGRSQLAYQLISIIVVFLQAIIFNRLLLNNKAFNENSYVPALVYVVCMSTNFEFLTLSPPLLSITFVLLAINNIFKRIDNFTRDELFLSTGLYLGIATLFYFPAFVFFLATLLSLILFSSAIPRRLILMTFGYLQVISVVAIYYYWFDAGKEFYFQFFYSTFSLDRIHFLNGTSLFRISLLMIFFLILSFFKLYSRNYYVNYQVKFQSVILINLVAAFATMFLEPQLSSFHLIVFVPVMAFFMSHFFLLIEKRWRAEIAFVIFLTFTFVYQSILDNDLKWVGQMVNYQKVMVKPPNNSFKERSLLVLGNRPSDYRYSTVATPYYDWQLAQWHLLKMDYYDVLTEVFRNFQEDPPDVIIDYEGLASTLFRKMPSIAKDYRAEGENTYVKIN